MGEGGIRSEVAPWGAGRAQQQRCKTAPRHPFAWPRARYVNIKHCQPGCYVAELGAKAFGSELRSDEGSRATRPFSSNAPAQRQPSRVLQEKPMAHHGAQAD